MIPYQIFSLSQQSRRERTEYSFSLLDASADLDTQVSNRLLNVIQDHELICVLLLYETKS
jgi:hypothetical protein